MGMGALDQQLTELEPERFDPGTILQRMRFQCHLVVPT